MGGLFVDEQSEEPVILFDEGTFPGESWENDEWTSHLLL